MTNVRIWNKEKPCRKFLQGSFFIPIMDKLIELGSNFGTSNDGNVVFKNHIIDFMFLTIISKIDIGITEIGDIYGFIMID